MKKRFCLFLCVVFTVMLVPFTSGCKHAQTVVNSYEITAEYAPEHQTLTGVVKVNFKNTTDNELSALLFQLYTNAYRENALYSPVYSTQEQLAYYNGKSYGETKVSSVNGAKSWTVTGEDENILSVTLVRSLFPDESVVLDLGFTVTLPEINHRFGIAENAVHLHRFFPVLCGVKNDGFVEVTPTTLGSPFALDCSDYKITLTLPKDYHILSSCPVDVAQSLESKTVYHVTGNGIRNLALALYTERSLLQTKIGECTVTYAYTKDSDAPETLRLIQDAFSYFQKRFGAYTYPTFTVLESAFAGYSDGYTAFVILSQDLTKTERVRLVVRELAKQWFGETLGVDRIHNAWLYEGLSEYVALTFFDTHADYGISQEKAVVEYVKEYRSYYDIYGNVLDRTDTKMTKPLIEYANDYEYRCLSVNKAVVLFDTLQKSIGEKRLTAGLKSFYHKYTYQTVDVGELVGTIEKQGVDVSGFFDGFLNGKVIL